MNIEILKCGSMVTTGSTVLKAIQNNEMPSLDLLVREAIQNSLDAKDPAKEYVNEEFNIGEFDYQKLDSYLEGIDLSDEKYSKLKFISLKDSNTEGLTGPIATNQVQDGQWGNFLSLVMNIGKAQETIGAGGSWGYGKTVYYRLGIGLVIFYSRIKEKGMFKSRLIACLVENEKSDKTIIPQLGKEPKSGIAWWGEKNNKEILPIQEENKIQDILSIFGIKPYELNETGTTVIIPYVDERQVLNETCSSQENAPWWCNTLEEYIGVSIQRWYATRLMNPHFRENPWLKVKINEKLFDVNTDMLPLFKIIQDLYNFNGRTNNDSEYKIESKDISLNKIFKDENLAGKINYVSLTKEQLKMTPPNNYKSPYTQINNRLDNDITNHHIIAFCRKPGMILRYDVDGKWISGLLDLTEDTYYIGLFLPNSNNIIKPTANIEISLEEYLRASEKADHENWTDITRYVQKDGTSIDMSNFKIVEKIQSNIKNKIRKLESENESHDGFGVGSKLNRQLAEFFLPKNNFGNRPNPVDAKGTLEKLSVRVETNKKSKIKLGNLEVNEKGELSKKFQILVCKKDRNIQLEFKVDSEAGKLAANSWEDEKVANSIFPIRLLRLEIEKIYCEQEVTNNELIVIKEDYESDEIKLQLLRSEKHNVSYGVKLEIKNENIQEIKGNIIYESIDPKTRVVLTIER